MAAQCFNCGKGVMYGSTHRHHAGVAGGRWKKRAPRTAKLFKPNLHSARIIISGFTKKVKLCTKCQRLLKKTNQEVSPTTQGVAQISVV